MYRSLYPDTEAPKNACTWRATAQSQRRRQGFCRETKAVETPILNEYHQRRLWALVRRGPDDQCWPWQAAKSGFGYGRFKLDGKLYSPHRLIYAFAHGPIPDVPQFHGAVVMHTCDNPACCNPKHLKLGTQVENVGDMFAKGRANRSRPPLSLPREGGRVAALFVDETPGGAYVGIPGVDVWGISRDARRYAGPHRVVCHSPCQRWGRFWHGSTRKPHQFEKGDDEGCFAAALAAVRRWGGVLEHPADSHAWAAFGLNRPPRAGGWVAADSEGGWTCHVEQGHYGHFSRKPTWLYAVGIDLPELIWGPGEQRLHPVALERHGYEKARRIGMAAMIGGKDKTRIREATPPAFRDLLLSMVAPPLALPREGGRV